MGTAMVDAFVFIDLQLRDALDQLHKLSILEASSLPKCDMVEQILSNTRELSVASQRVASEAIEYLRNGTWPRDSKMVETVFPVHVLLSAPPLQLDEAVGTVLRER